MSFTLDCNESNTNDTLRECWKLPLDTPYLLGSAAPRRAPRSLLILYGTLHLDNDPSNPILSPATTILIPCVGVTSGKVVPFQFSLIGYCSRH